MVKVYADASMNMKIKQFLVSGRAKPSEKNQTPQVYAMRVFAKDGVLAKSKFWKQMSLLNKIKRANGQVLSVNEIFEKNPNHVKTYGVALKYQSRTYTHNIYKEFRDVTLNGAVSQLHMEMSGNHRTDHSTIQIMRTATLKKAADIKRAKSLQYRDAKIKFPMLKTIRRPSQRKFRTNFKAQRPNTFA